MDGPHHPTPLSPALQAVLAPHAAGEDRITITGQLNVSGREHEAQDYSTLNRFLESAKPVPKNSPQRPSEAACRERVMTHTTDVPLVQGAGTFSNPLRDRYERACPEGQTFQERLQRQSDQLKKRIRQHAVHMQEVSDAHTRALEDIRLRNLNRNARQLEQQRVTLERRLQAQHSHAARAHVEEARRQSALRRAGLSDQARRAECAARQRQQEMKHVEYLHYKQQARELKQYEGYIDAQNARLVRQRREEFEVQRREALAQRVQTKVLMCNGFDASARAVCRQIGRDTRVELGDAEEMFNNRIYHVARDSGREPDPLLYAQDHRFAATHGYRTACSAMGFYAVSGHMPAEH